MEEAPEAANAFNGLIGSLITDLSNLEKKLDMFNSDASIIQFNMYSATSL
jgi:hypothetical protein